MKILPAQNTSKSDKRDLQKSQIISRSKPTDPPDELSDDFPDIEEDEIIISDDDDKQDNVDLNDLGEKEDSFHAEAEADEVDEADNSKL